MENKVREGISIVIPCYQSEDYITQTLQGIADAFTDNRNEIEVICVVDGSTDDVAAVIRKHKAPFDLKVIELTRNFGQHNALLAGIREANFEYCATMDDDGQHLPMELVGMHAFAFEQKYDLVYGKPKSEEHGFVRSLASRSVKFWLTVLGNKHARDISAFRLFRTELRDAFAHVSDPNVQLDALLAWSTNNVGVVEVEMRPRSAGRSGYSFPKLLQYALNMITAYSTKPLRAITYIGFLASVIGFGLGVFILGSFFLSETTPTGFTSIAFMVSTFSGIQMLAIGVLGEYLARSHGRISGQPMYVIRQEGCSEK
jgi:undecaprenyl-phosphate 4-deoxy-4-formamido-L-arabinose transferase